MADFGGWPKDSRWLGWRRGLLPRTSAPARDRGDGPAGIETRLCPYRLLLLRTGGSAGRQSCRRRTGRAGRRLFRQRRIGGDRGLDQAGAAIFYRKPPAAAVAFHFGPPELSPPYARP